ncbi:MAG: alanine--tRNA ligase [Candidatus Magasanikbacteria bacterium]|nr:alanine--tRNA ligase [Candidatus Magasanikbacteria bacterium]
MTTKELRQKYLEFFEKKGHSIISSASLIPENDPTVLFTTAGMHPLVPYLMGEKHPEGKRVTSVQKCIRTGDIDEVGDNSHLTFFEMLGNWSLGDYFKKEAIEWSYEFLTSKDYLGIDPKKLAVTVFEGDEDAPLDTEAKQAWLDLGISEEKISALPKKDNWWGPAGQTGPCGPDSEMFYWVGEGEFPPEGSNVATDEDNWMEIWNDVFMQYNKNIDGSFTASEQKNVDTGMGVERVVALLNGYKEVYKVDTLWPIVEVVENLSGKKYEEETLSMRVIVDHLRAATMIMGDNLGLAPSNVDQGYVVRKLIRRSIRHGKKLGIDTNFCGEVASKAIEVLGSEYTELEKNKDFVLREIKKEEEQFRKTLESGIKEFEKLLKGFQMAFEKTNRKITEISGKQAFKLYDTYGFPYEMTEELAHEHDLTVDKAGFDSAFEKHQELSRKGAEQKFKGGMADTGEMSVKYHTTTHLLHVALKRVLGDHVAQKGSNITADRLRFDFTHGEKMTPEERTEVETLVNAAIARDYPISFTEMTVEEAKAQGAIGLFGDKYGEKVKVYTVGDPAGMAEGNPESDTFSKEICGGPHVESTGVLGKFRIKKEESSSAGIRRVKGVLEDL